MTSLMHSSPIPPDLEPDDEWKQSLKLNIEAGLRSMVDEAKQKLNDELAKGIVGPEARDRLTADHLAALKNIRQLAEEQFRIALERERQERRWAAGEQLDRAWSESMIKEQQAILDRIEREKNNRASSVHSDPPPPPPPPPPPFHVPISESSAPTPVPRIAPTPPERDGPYFTSPDVLAASPDDAAPSLRSARKVRAASITSTGSWKAPSVLESEKSFSSPSKPQIYDDPLDAHAHAQAHAQAHALPRRTSTDPVDPTRKESIRRKPSMSARPIVQEFWKPSITPEEDAQMSRTFTLARRGSTASATSYKAPSVLGAVFADPLDVVTASPTTSTSTNSAAADQEWSRHVDGGFSPTAAAAAGYGPRMHAPPPSASRPIVTTKKSFTLDDAFPSSSSPSSRYWNTPRSPYESRWEGGGSGGGASSRSPQTPEDAVARSWQSQSQQQQQFLRGRFSSQDMHHHYHQHQQDGGGGGGHHGRHVHTHHEDFDQEDGSDDGFDRKGGWPNHAYADRRIQEIEDSLRKREDAANRREQELSRKAEQLRREDEARKAEEERRRSEEEAKQRQDDDAERKEAELRRMREEAERKEKEAAAKEEEAKRMEEEARRKEEEARRKEQEAKKKEREARLKEEEAKRKEKEAKSRELETKRKEEELKRKELEATSRELEALRIQEETRRREEEVRMKEEDARRKEYEAKRKQEEAERKEEEARRKAEEARKKEDELRRREEDLRRREEDLSRREADMRRREDDKLVQEEFRRREEDIRRQRAEERKKQEVWETWPPETFRPTPSPQTPNASNPWPIPNRTERSASNAASPPVDRVSTSASGRSSTTSGWSTASGRPSSTASSQTSSGTPKPPGPSTPAPRPPPPSNTPSNTPLTEAEFHRRQAEQAQQREEQFRREQARIAMQEHERQTKAGKTMSKEEVVKLFEAHRNQWDKIQTMGSLIWEDFPWPMFKRPKGPDELTSPAITSYMLSSIHPQDRATKERIRDNIRRWHPDRFNSQLLPKVKENERERVSEGAGTVARILNDLLRMHSQDTF